MKILAIETTGPKASVAVLTEEGIWQEGCQEQMNHLRYLMPMISQVLRDSGQALGEIDVIAVSEGPGSFTGIRIGVASAKALAQALDKPVVTVPTLKSFVYHERAEKLLALTAFDARRSQVYGSLCRWDGNQVCSLVADGAYLAAELAELSVQSLTENKEALLTEGFDKILLYGDGAALMEQELADCGAREVLSEAGFRIARAAESLQYQQASSIATYARDLLREAPAKHYALVKPVYLRKAEAERKLEEKLKEEQS